MYTFKKIILLILKLHYGLDSPVVVVQINSANHFCSFKVTNLDSYFADSVAANQLHHLLCGCITGVHFDRRQFNVLPEKNINGTVSSE